MIAPPPGFVLDGPPPAAAPPTSPPPPPPGFILDGTSPGPAAPFTGTPPAQGGPSTIGSAPPSTVAPPPPPGFQLDPTPSFSPGTVPGAPIDPQENFSRYMAGLGPSEESQRQYTQQADARDRLAAGGGLPPVDEGAQTQAAFNGPAATPVPDAGPGPQYNPRPSAGPQSPLEQAVRRAMPGARDVQVSDSFDPATPTPADAARLQAAGDIRLEDQAQAAGQDLRNLAPNVIGGLGKFTAGALQLGNKAIEYSTGGAVHAPQSVDDFLESGRQTFSQLQQNHPVATWEGKMVTGAINAAPQIAATLAAPESLPWVLGATGGTNAWNKAKDSGASDVHAAVEAGLGTGIGVLASYIPGLGGESIGYVRGILQTGASMGVQSVLDDVVAKAGHADPKKTADIIQDAITSAGIGMVFHAIASAPGALKEMQTRPLREIAEKNGLDPDDPGILSVIAKMKTLDRQVSSGKVSMVDALHALDQSLTPQEQAAMARQVARDNPPRDQNVDIGPPPEPDIPGAQTDEEINNAQPKGAPNAARTQQEQSPVEHVQPNAQDGRGPTEITPRPAPAAEARPAPEQQPSPAGIAHAEDQRAPDLRQPAAGSEGASRAQEEAPAGDVTALPPAIAEARARAQERDLNDAMREGGTPSIKDTIDPKVGQQFFAHGTANISTLNDLLQKGIDPSRQFYSEPLSGGEGLLRDAQGFLVVSKPGKPIADGIQSVIVPNHYAPEIPVLQKQYPAVQFLSRGDAPQALATQVMGDRGPVAAKEVEAPAAPPPAKPKAPPKPFTKPDLQKRIQELNKQQGGGLPDDVAQFAESLPDAFTFKRGGQYSGEVARLAGGKEAGKTGAAIMRSKAVGFTDDSAKAGGEDAIQAFRDRYGEKGEDFYWQVVRDRAGIGFQDALDRARNSPDPNHQLAAAIYDNLPSGKTPQKLIKPGEEIPTDSQFELNGHTMRVTEDADGIRVLRDGDDYPVLPVDDLEHVPYDKGTFKAGEEPEVPEHDPFGDLKDEETPQAIEHKPEFFDADAAGVSKPKSGLFGQTVFDGATGNQQGAMFDMSKPASQTEAIAGSKNALDPRNTAELFPVKAKSKMEQGILDAIAAADVSKMQRYIQTPIGRQLFEQATGASLPPNSTPEQRSAAVEEWVQKRQANLKSAEVRPAEGRVHNMSVGGNPQPTPPQGGKRFIPSRGNVMVEGAGRGYPADLHPDTLKALAELYHDHPEVADHVAVIFTNSLNRVSAGRIRQQYGPGHGGAGGFVAGGMYPLYSGTASPAVRFWRIPGAQGVRAWPGRQVAAEELAHVQQQMIEHERPTVWKKIEAFSKLPNLNPQKFNAREWFARELADAYTLGKTNLPPVVAQPAMDYLTGKNVWGKAAWDRYKQSQINTPGSGFPSITPDENRPSSGKTHFMATGAPASPGGGGASPGGGGAGAIPQPSIKDILFGPGSAGEAAANAVAAPIKGAREIADQVKRVVAPQTRGVDARLAANSLRDMMARMDMGNDRDVTRFQKMVNQFDREPLAEQIKFIDRLEHGALQDRPEFQPIADALRDFNDQWLDKIRSLGTGKLQQANENYVGRIWKDPEAAAPFMAKLFSKKPLEGSKGFLKKRSLEYFLDGIGKGLEPITYNPIEMMLFKGAEMRRYYEMWRTFRDMQAKGLAKFVATGADAPENWRPVPDRMFEVWAPPEAGVRAAFDAGLRNQLIDLANKLGVSHQRVNSLGVKNAWGMSGPGAEIKTRFGGPDFVIAHELGHQIEDTFHFLKKITTDPDPAMNRKLQAQINSLADARFEHDPTASKEFRKYVRDADEKAATVVQAYVSARGLFARLAPDVLDRFEQFIGDTPAIWDLSNVEPSLTLASEKGTVDTAGPQLIGKYHVPDEVAQLYDNMLSKSILQRSGAARALFGANNLFNSLNLSLSPFHILTTTFNSIATEGGRGLVALTRGDLGVAGKALVSTPFSPARDFVRGHQMIKHWYKPGKLSKPVQEVFDAWQKGGGRPTMDKAFRVTAIQAIVREWRKTQGVKAEGVPQLYRAAQANALAITLKNSPAALIQALGTPVLNWYVPRLKAGAAYYLIQQELAQLPAGANDDQVRRAAQRAVDAIDNRFGQVVHDNMFLQKWAKETMMMTQRSSGWNQGTVREGAGAVLDIPSAPFRAYRGHKGTADPAEETALTHRMGYALAVIGIGMLGGALLNRWMTGEWPKEWKDYVWPRTGALDENGNPVRLKLPTYLNDWIGMGTKPLQTAAAKASPAVSITNELFRNRDYYGTQIRDPKASALDQAKSVGKHLLKAAEPFTLASAKKLKEQGASPLAQRLSYAGIQETSPEYSLTDAQRILRDGMPSEFPMRTQKQAERAQEKRAAVHDVRKGADAVASLKEHGIAEPTRRDVQSVNKKATTAATSRMVEQTHDPVLLMRAWRVMTPAEKIDAKPFVQRALIKNTDFDAVQRDAWRKEVNETTPSTHPTTQPASKAG